MGNIEPLIKQLQPPILVLGASGFIGANLFRALYDVRQDVTGTASRLPAWRLGGIPNMNLAVVDLLNPGSLESTLKRVRPRTIFNLVAYGAYSFEKDPQRIYETNFNFVYQLLEYARTADTFCLVHAGSSSEYGMNADAPSEDDRLLPNSHYSVSKIGSSYLLHYYGKHLGVRCASLRIYSAFGPLEDSSRLIPTLIRGASQGRLPDFADPEISRDFVYIDDVVEAFLKTAVNLPTHAFGESFNIGSGIQTTLRNLAAETKRRFRIEADPQFATYPKRDWDVQRWRANPEKAAALLDWRATTSFGDGLDRTFSWYSGLPNREEYHRSSKQFLLSEKHSVSVVLVTQHVDEYLTKLCAGISEILLSEAVDYEIVIVVDNMEGGQAALLTELSSHDRHIRAIFHSRTFGYQAAYISGMEYATKNAVILLRAERVGNDLSFLTAFLGRWRDGYDVVFGLEQVARESRIWHALRAILYHMYNFATNVPLPLTSSDVCLMDARVVKHVLGCKERTVFLKGLRAFVGFRQMGVEFTPRRERSFFTAREVLRKAFFAKVGLLSFSRTPLTLLTFVGTILFLLSCVMALINALFKLLDPDFAPAGITTVLLYIQFFGSLNLLALSLLGEYLGAVFDESKRRPLFIRSKIIERGVQRDVPY